MTRRAAALALAALTALTARPTPLHAAFEEKGAGARAPGLGNAFGALADDVYAIHYNPAGLAQLERPEIATAYSRLFMGLTDNSNLSQSFIGYAHPLKGGRLGTTATSWEQFSLNNSLYQEHTFSLAYGRRLASLPGRGDLLGGVTGKYLRRSFGSFPEADNAMTQNGLVVGVGQADPVLSGKRSMGAPDADLGLLVKLPRYYSFGLQLGHVLQPNVAFDKSDTDKLPLSVRLSMAYRTLLSAITAQVESRKSPLGGQDQLFTLGFERWFPRLFIGDFGLRGALTNGSREHRNASLGLSYKTRRLGFDYAFGLPISGVASTSGNHRVSVSARFGSLNDPDESVELILDAMRKLKAGIIPEIKTVGPGLVPSQKVLLDEHVAQARSLQSQARYKDAFDRLGQAVAMSPSDPQLLKAYGRLNFVVQFVPALDEHKTDPVHAALHQGILSYLGGRDKEAIEKVTYAWSLKPQHKGLEAFLAQLELNTGQRRPPVVKAPGSFEVEQMLTRSLTAIEEGRYQDALKLSLNALKMDETNAAAWENIGTAYFAMADYPRSLKAWEQAYRLQADPLRRSAARGYLKAIERLMKRRAAQAETRPRAPEGPAAPAKPAAPQAPAEEIEKVYNEGVDLYTQGRLQEAKRAFERVLLLDPEHVPAAKALRRVMEESGGRQ